jgi:two-component system, NtrC family, response regulator AtoC
MSKKLLDEIEELRFRLQEAEGTLDAIRRGEVDALVISGPDGEQVYTLTGADRTYRIVLETMNEGAAVIGSDGTVLFCNARLSGMLKTPCERILGASMARFVTQEDTQSFEALLNRSLVERQQMELTLKAGAGDFVPARISTSPIFLEDSATICMIVTDITEQKRARQALRVSEERFRALVESAQDLIFMKDRRLTYTHVNPAMARVFGLDASEIIGRMEEGMYGERSGKHIKQVELRVLQGESVEEEYTASIKGVPFTLNTVRTPLRDAEGTIVGIYGISRDVTDRKRTVPTQRPIAEAYPSQAMRAALNEARLAAATDIIVLLQGESGSGKDYLARWIHDHSRRGPGPYFAVNCAAISKDLAESELFGHERGSFTGAHARKRGLLELAEGGTLLLNEIGELTLSLQSKLLTFLDTRSFLRVGGEKSITVNARIIAATNRSLETEVVEGRFLSPLLYRLNVFAIHVPPLRDRVEDIPVLLEEIMSMLAKELQLTSLPAITPASVTALSGYDWPGNVRELRNVLERSLMLTDGQNLNLALPSIGANHQSWSHVSSFPVHERTLHDVTDEVIKSLCLEALRRCEGNRRCAARVLGISRDSLYRHIKRFGIEGDNPQAD